MDAQKRRRDQRGRRTLGKRNRQRTLEKLEEKRRRVLQKMEKEILERRKKEQEEEKKAFYEWNGMMTEEQFEEIEAIKREIWRRMEEEIE